jgi:hypothetical protein
MRLSRFLIAVALTFYGAYVTADTAALAGNQQTPAVQFLSGPEKRNGVAKVKKEQISGPNVRNGKVKSGSEGMLSTSPSARPNKSNGYGAEKLLDAKQIGHAQSESNMSTDI